MNRKAFFLTAIFFCYTVHSIAQHPPKGHVDIDLFILDLFNEQNEDFNFEELYESLYQFHLNPLDINAATRDELASLFILSELQLTNMIKYRALIGPFISLYELQAVPGLDL
ncbi:MAG: ComEA family DNA-binding protein, partial [Cytophagaceae bacterium]